MRFLSLTAIIIPLLVILISPFPNTGPARVEALPNPFIHLTRWPQFPRLPGMTRRVSRLAELLRHGGNWSESSGGNTTVLLPSRANLFGVPMNIYPPGLQRLEILEILERRSHQRRVGKGRENHGKDGLQMGQDGKKDGSGLNLDKRRDPDKEDMDEIHNTMEKDEKNENGKNEKDDKSNKEAKDEKNKHKNEKKEKKHKKHKHKHHHHHHHHILSNHLEYWANISRGIEWRNSHPDAYPARQVRSNCDGDAYGSRHDHCRFLRPEFCADAINRFMDNVTYFAYAQYGANKNSVVQNMQNHGCMAIYECESPQAYERAQLTGREIKQYFLQLYEQNGCDVCATSWLSNGCYVRTTACMKLACQDVLFCLDCGEARMLKILEDLAGWRSQHAWDPQRLKRSESDDSNADDPAHETVEIPTPKMETRKFAFTGLLG